MNIKRRLRISYILMLLIPVCLIMLTGGIIRHIYDTDKENAKLPGAFYREIYGTMAEDPERLMERDYLKHLENLTGHKGRVNIYVTRMRNAINSLENIRAGKHGHDRYPGDIFTKWDFRYSDGASGEISILLFGTREFSNKFSGAFISGGFILLAAIVILLLTNGLLSWYMARSITKPLKILEEAAYQIKEEDLETPVIYEGKDEFDRVCRAFEEMRIRLKDSLYEQMRYEENRKELLSNISHDLKTPITAIKGYMEGIRDGIADTPEKVDRYLDTIYSKSVLMNDLIDRLFLFSKLDLGKIHFDFKEVGLSAFLSDTCEELRFDYPSMTIELKCPEEEIFLKADSTHLHRVINNLIDNAGKYSGRDDAVVQVALARKGSYASVSIRDNGQGIDSESLPRIFERFYRGDPSRSPLQEGSGLGLSIARHIVTAHNGTINGRNVPGGGLEITFTLKVSDEKDSHH